MLVGLTGRARSGKDTVADHLVACFGFRKVSIAEPLKEVCRVVFGWSDDQLHGHAKDHELPDVEATPRQVMQFVGTELFRVRLGERFPALGTNVWVDALAREIDQNPDESLVVADVRFPNEAQTIRERGGIIIHVDRNCGSSDEHSSETAHRFIAPDYTVFNTSSKADLFRMVDRILEDSFR